MKRGQVWGIASLAVGCALIVCIQAFPGLLGLGARFYCAPGAHAVIVSSSHSYVDTRGHDRGASGFDLWCLDGEESWTRHHAVERDFALPLAAVGMLGGTVVLGAIEAYRRSRKRGAS